MTTQREPAGAPLTGGHGDPRAVRVTIAPSSEHAGLAALVVEPAPGPAPGAPESGDATVLVDGGPIEAGLIHHGSGRATLVLAGNPGMSRHAVLLATAGTPAGAPASSGVERRELIVDGWRIEVDVESERRAALRARAGRGRQDAAKGGPAEVRAIIPGVVLSVSVVPGDEVVAGQQLLVVEAMKMQNELRAPRDGRIGRVAVGAGQTIEVGDVLLVVE